MKQFVLLLLFISTHAFAQNKVIPHLTSNMLKDGTLSLQIKDAWKYHAGDDLNWAEPNFDDTGWYNIEPNGLGADDMPHSLWTGYGWWRMTFTADTAIYKHITRLYFRGWGAADVYLDGEKIQSYGNFSTQAAHEKNFVPRFSVDRHIQITPKDLHVLAIRYSNHQAKRNQEILKHNAPSLGFSIGLDDENKGVDSDLNYAYGIATLSVITAILLLLFLLNILLFFKFQKDKANLFISYVIAAFLISTITNYPQIFMELTGFWNTIFRGLINAISYGLGLVLIPYTLTLIFQFNNFYWTKHLVWLVVIRAFFYFFPFIPIIIWDSTFIVFIFSTIAFLMYQAIKMKKPGVHYLTVGAIVTSVFILIDRLYATSFIHLSTEGFYIVLLLLFISFPVGLSAYVTSQYGRLYFFMEKEVANRTSDLNESLENLKTTQDQLIQKEKLASLGELTAGIAHEIQNPLNFVNNFSELSVDLAKDLNDEIHKPDIDKTYVVELLTDLTSNQEKINHHGKRASSIVKGMLEHSRASTGVRELTDINKLTDEYLRLSYHGLRAKDKSFNADYELIIDENLPKIEVIPQDIGRVLLNLINNAFYAVNEKKKQNTEGGYNPTVSVSTQQLDKQIIIKIKDNGIGMSEATKAKVFQPFFTTKPTGQGTGLGLSISYDIVTKGHGGTFDIKTKEGEFTEFIIQLPYL